MQKICRCDSYADLIDHLERGHYTHRVECVNDLRRGDLVVGEDSGAFLLLTAPPPAGHTTKPVWLSPEGTLVYLLSKRCYDDLEIKYLRRTRVSRPV